MRTPPVPAMEALAAALVQEEKERFPATLRKRVAYGTAGFRDKNDVLDRVIFRVGIVAALRSKCIKGTVGLVITASHNPVEDNGIKVCESLGEMLVPEWEEYATQLANTRTEDLPTELARIVRDSGCDLSQSAKVAFARDTRPSGPRLAEHLKKSLELMGSKCIDYGILTTPQLHYMVRCVTTNGAFGEPTEEGYYLKLAAAFKALTPKSIGPACHVKLDGANGVGADKMKRLMQHIDSRVLSVEVVNDGDGVLNEKCGADHVKNRQLPPEGLSYGMGERCVSFDGDADRIVFFYMDEEEKFRMLDGDKIAALAAGFISEKLRLLESDLTIGVVQTAYSNGNATSYLQEEQKIPVVFTATGVKHLHHKALEFDVGVYFEANGHGTVVFSQRAIETFKMAAEDDSLSPAVREAAVQLGALTELINQTVGDAISDLLMVETILRHRGWNCKSWNEIYRELPNRNTKIKVKDRMAIKTTNFERMCLSPEALQPEIDKLVAEVEKGRSFVRPSGTEDIVRIYAEAETQAAADDLALQVAVKVHELAGGVGDPPTSFA